MTIAIRRIVPSILAISITGVMALVLVRGQGWMFDRDWFTYWGGGRGLLDGANLYDPSAWSRITFSYGSTWLPNPVFIYAPPTAIIFAPLSALSVQASGVIWVWLSQIFIALAVVLTTKELRWSRVRSFAPFIALGIALFTPALLTLLMGQVSALILLIVVLTAILVNREKWLAAGLLLGLAIVKPQPVLFFIPMFGLWLVLNRRWLGLVGLLFSFSLGAITSFLLFPNFLVDWQSAAMNKVGGVAARMPTIWGLGADLFGTSPLGLWSSAVLAVIVLLASIVIVSQLRDSDALTFSSVLVIPSMLIAPYLWTYDQVLLILPLIVAVIRLDQLEVSFTALALLPWASVVLAWALFIAAAARLSDSWTSLLPLMVGAILWFTFRPRRMANKV